MLGHNEPELELSPLAKTMLSELRARDNIDRADVEARRDGPLEFFLAWAEGAGPDGAQLYRQATGDCAEQALRKLLDRYNAGDGQPWLRLRDAG